MHKLILSTYIHIRVRLLHVVITPVKCNDLNKVYLQKIISHIFYLNWQILSSKYVFSNKELQNNMVKTAGLGDRIQAKHTQKKPILI